MERLGVKIEEKDAELQKMKSNNNSLKNKVNEASRGTASEIEQELEIVNKQFEKQIEVLTGKHSAEKECQRQELRKVNEERVNLMGQIETLQVSIAT